MKGIVWLASYPKSGNTWFRTFLTNFLHPGDEPADINALVGGPIASARLPFDEALGYDSGEMTHDEIDAIRPEFYLQKAHEATETLFCKIHDAYTFLPDGRPLVPVAATQCVLYFLRNPLDVAVSLAHHSGHRRFDQIIQMMADDRSAFCEVDATEFNQLRQRLLSWSNHVLSWVKAPDICVHVLRYEDMIASPAASFRAAIRFSGLPDDPARLSRAIQFSDFNESRRQEALAGFREKLPRANSFFRQGKVGSWRQSLNPEQIARVVADHRAVMRQFGYLDEKDQLTC